MKSKTTKMVKSIQSLINLLKPWQNEHDFAQIFALKNFSLLTTKHGEE
jgi:hypothetical protein